MCIVLMLVLKYEISIYPDYHYKEVVIMNSNISSQGRSSVIRVQATVVRTMLIVWMSAHCGNLDILGRGHMNKWCYVVRSKGVWLRGKGVVHL